MFDSVPAMAPDKSGNARERLRSMPHVAPIASIVAEADAVVRQISQLRTSVRSADRAVERANWLHAFQRIVDAAQVAFTQTLGEFDKCRDGRQLTGASSTTAWCRDELRLAPGEVQTRLRLARLANSEPLIAEALDKTTDGQLRFEQVRQISHSVRCLDGEQKAPEAMALLTDLAATEDPGVIRAAGRRIADVVNPDGVLAAAHRQFERRYLHMSPMLDGMTAVEGLLDAESTAIVEASFAPLMVAAGPDDARTAAQRRADALAEIATLASKSGELPRLSGSACSVDVLITGEGLAALTRVALHRNDRNDGNDTHRPPASSTAVSEDDVDARVRTAVARDHLAGLAIPGQGLVLDHPGLPAVLPPTTVERLLCDSRVGRVLWGSASAPIDLGRRVRLFSADQRRLLAVRDGGCRWPGCSRPPRYTDAHHVVSWMSGGKTDLANAVLLCRHHHRLIHEPRERGGWWIEVGDRDFSAHSTLAFRNASGIVAISQPRGPT